MKKIGEIFKSLKDTIGRRSAVDAMKTVNWNADAVNIKEARPSAIILHGTGRPDGIKDFGRYFEDRPVSTESMGMSVEDFGKSVTQFAKSKAPYSAESWLDIGESIHEGFVEGVSDARYNEPKSAPLSSFEEAEEVIHDNDIYSKVREKIENVQRKQVAYGLDKYPEPLNADTWSIEETIDHIMDETMDKMHYLAMLQIKLKEMPEHKHKEYDDMMDAYIHSVPKMSYHLAFEDMQPTMVGADADGDSAVDMDLSDEPEKPVRVNVETSVTSQYDTNTQKLRLDIEFDGWDTTDDIRDAVIKQFDAMMEGRDL